jgi:hypothetical protein
VLYTMVSLWTVYVFRKKKLSFLIPIVASASGALNGFIAGSIIGM